MTWMKLLTVVAVFVCICSVSLAEEQAATSQLPAALAALRVPATNVVSEGEAHQIRGKWGCGSSTSPVFSQLKSFCVYDGWAEGTILLFEGVIGEFQYESNDGMLIQGQFGGLTGTVGVDEGDLVFSLQGKAYQETLEFSGPFEQHFSQSFGF